MSAPRFTSLRSRFLLIVLFGAVLPLAIAGSWLAESSVHSAQALLRSQLDTSVATVASEVEDRWVYRRSDLLLLARNEVTERTVASPAPSASPADSAFMTRLYQSLQSTLLQVRLSRMDGTVRWSFAAAEDTTANPNRLAGAPARAREPYLLDTVVIQGTESQPLGLLEAHIRLSAVLPVDSVPILVTAARLTVADHRTGRTFEFARSGDAPAGLDHYLMDGRSWVAAHRTVTGPSLDLTVAAPSDAYVGPFERAAKLELLMLVGVIALALVLSVFFTRRLTRSLERLVTAADAVAAGDLQRDVDVRGTDEVSRLARSFHTMLESLRRTLQELAHREALAAVGEFAASLSHEVRNGLTAVRVDLQRVEESQLPDDTTHTLVIRALRNVHRLDTTVTGALAVARSGRAELEPMALRGVLVASIAGAESAFTSAAATLSLDLDGDAPCSVRADGGALERLFLNLLLNAAQAMTPGGSATVKLTADDAACTVAITDNGSGMRTDQLAQSGQPFYSSKRGGTGLGLSIARKIAEAHGGALTIESEPGKGTIVRVRLPRI